MSSSSSAVSGPAKPTLSEINATSISVPVLSEFLSLVPHQLTAVLVHLAPYISVTRHAAEIIHWRSSWYDSWLAIAAWWGICLLAELSLRYLLPIAILFILSLSKWTLQPRFIPPPITELNLQTTITDLSTIQALVPTTSAFALPPLPVPVLLRVAATIYVPYLLLTYVVPLRVILGVTGTLLLSWHAPWAVVLRTTLWRSAWVRWGLYHTWSCISGQPLPVVSHALQVASTPPEPVNSLRFLFQIYENQRWWMGLDWTAALLPGERPSWCSAPPSLHPVSPPNAFSLPEESTVFLADGKGGREKRTATWRWEEAEWKVAVRLQGTPLTRVEKPLPSLKEENPSLLAKAAAKTREAAGGSGGPGGGGDGNGDKHGEDDDEAEEEEDVTDGDGWIYGDNKWEGKSDKGSGLGKYTRYRRWTRVAVVSEVVEHVEDGELGVQRGRTNTLQSPTSITRRDSSRRDSGSVDRGSPLRNRLQNALHKGSISTAS